MELNISNNLVGEDLKDFIKTFNFKPKRNHVVITLNQYVSDSELEIIGDNKEELLSEWQYVIAVGSGVEYNPGEKVLVDLKRMTERIPNPENRMEYIERVNVLPYNFNDKFLTIVSDNFLLGNEIELPEIDMKA